VSRSSVYKYSCATRKMLVERYSMLVARRPSIELALFKKLRDSVICYLREETKIQEQKEKKNRRKTPHEKRFVRFATSFSDILPFFFKSNRKKRVHNVKERELQWKRNLPFLEAQQSRRRRRFSSNRRKSMLFLISAAIECLAKPINSINSSINSWTVHFSVEPRGTEN